MNLKKTTEEYAASVRLTSSEIQPKICPPEQKHERKYGVTPLTQTHSAIPVGEKTADHIPGHIRAPLQSNLTDKLTPIILRKIGWQIFEIQGPTF